MGDRCSMQITCKKEHAERFAYLFDITDEDASNGTVTMEAEEANYAYGVWDGNSGELPNDIPYYGMHGDGGDYSAGIFACDGQFIFRAADTDNRGRYLISFDEFGNPAQGDIVHVKGFLKFYRKVTAIVHGEA